MNSGDKHSELLYFQVNLTFCKLVNIHFSEVILSDYYRFWRDYLYKTGGAGGKLIFVVLWLTIFSVDELWIMIDVHSMKPKLPQSSIVYTYIEDRLKK